MSLYIFDGLIYHHRIVQDLENCPCIHFMHYSLVAEHLKQEIERDFYISIDYHYMLYWIKLFGDSVESMQF